MLKRAAVLLMTLALLTAPRADAAARHLYDVRIPLTVDEPVEVRLPDGARREIGRVLMLPERSRHPSYTASAWAEPGCVAASAVNAVHILLAVEDGKGRTMSIIPRETIAPAAGAGASVVVSSRAGTELFGAWAPPVGTKIFVERRRSADGGRTVTVDSVPLSELGGAIPKDGDVMVLRVEERDDMPYMVDIENRPGGRVIAWGYRGPKTIGRVIRRVAGSGRFEGTLFQDAGRVRANHTGVIDISTCEYGRTGGFQIIPWEHVISSKEMQGAWSMTQWMIIAPTDAESNMGGTFPLFSGALVPGPSQGEQLWDIWSTYGRRPLAMARIDGGEWMKFPVSVGREDSALRAVTHIRIYFPITAEPNRR